MLERIFSFIPFTKSYKQRVNTKKEKELKVSLYQLQDSFENAVNYKDVYIMFERILNSPSLKLSNRFITNKSTKVSFLTKTSQKALELIDYKVYDQIRLDRRKDLISFSGETKSYHAWESNRESVLLLYSFMNVMISKAILLGTQEESRVTLDELEFLRSILFRYLCSDLIKLLIFYMEESNETNVSVKTAL